MELTKLLPVERWIELEKDICMRSGLDINVFNADGLRITSFKQWVNRLCPGIKADDRGQSFICATAHMNIAGMARQGKQAVIEECDAGLLKMVVPIFVEGEYTGVIGGCGLLLEGRTVDSFMINRTTGMDEGMIAELSEGMKQITMAEADAVAEYIKECIERIVKDFERSR